MQLNEYQKLAHATSHNTTIGGNALLYPVLGLAGETGELVNKVKKLHRDNGGEMNAAHRDAILQETGDLLWYLAEICTQLHVDLETVAYANIEKLASRAERGVIGGSGDYR